MKHSNHKHSNHKEKYEGEPEHGERHETGEKEPRGNKSSDASGEKRVKMTNGVGLGKADATRRESDHGKHDGRTGEHNTGRKEGHFYHHKRG